MCGSALHELQRPGFADREVRQRERPQRRVGALARQQLGGALQHTLETTHPPGAEQLHGHERGFGAHAAVRGQVVEGRARPRDESLRFRPARPAEAVGRADGRELRIALRKTRGEAGEQRAERRLLAVEDEVDPVPSEQPDHQGPVLAECRVADRLDGMVPVGEPGGRRAMQLDDLLRRVPVKLDAQ